MSSIATDLFEAVAIESDAKERRTPKKAKENDVAEALGARTAVLELRLMVRGQARLGHLEDGQEHAMIRFLDRLDAFVAKYLEAEKAKEL